MLPGEVTPEGIDLCSQKWDHPAAWCRNTTGDEPVPWSLNVDSLQTGRLNISAIGVATMTEGRVGS